MATKTELEARLAFKKSALEKAQAAYLALLDGNVVSYSIGGRSLTRLDLGTLKAQIDELERDIATLEAVLAGGRPRKAVGVIPRDW